MYFFFYIIGFCRLGSLLLFLFSSPATVRLITHILDEYSQSRQSSVSSAYNQNRKYVKVVWSPSTIYSLYSSVAEEEAKREKKIRHQSRKLNLNQISSYMRLCCVAFAWMTFRDAENLRSHQ